MRSALQHARKLVVVAVAGLTVTMSATFVWAVAKTIRLIATLLDGGWRSDTSMVDLLEVIETYLLAIVQLIVAIGLYELFIAALDVPPWMRARSLDDLKKSIVDILIVFIGIKGVERLLSSERPLDTLAYTGSVAVLIAALTLFRLKPSRGEPVPSAGVAASGPGTGSPPAPGCPAGVDPDGS